MKCMIKGWKRIIPERGVDLETEDWVGKWISEREKEVWEVERSETIERDREEMI